MDVRAWGRQNECIDDCDTLFLNARLKNAIEYFHAALSDFQSISGFALSGFDNDDLEMVYQEDRFGIWVFFRGNGGLWASKRHFLFPCFIFLNNHAEELVQRFNSYVRSVIPKVLMRSSFCKCSESCHDGGQTRHGERYMIFGNPTALCRFVQDRWLCEWCIDIISSGGSLPSSQMPNTAKSTASTPSREISRGLRFDVLERDNFTCRGCGASPLDDSSIKLHVDHIHPVSRGGKTSLDNLQVLCSDCNLGKKAKITDKMDRRDTKAC